MKTKKYHIYFFNPVIMSKKIKKLLKTVPKTGYYDSKITQQTKSKNNYVEHSNIYICLVLKVNFGRWPEGCPKPLQELEQGRP